MLSVGGRKAGAGAVSNQHGGGSRTAGRLQRKRSSRADIRGTDICGADIHRTGLQGGADLCNAGGNTEKAAGYIAKAAGGDLFELEPVEPYTDEDLNWSDDNSRVTVEHENPDQREVELVKDIVEDWDTYDTVFIGYPIWWGIVAWPVDGFVKANDFTGKTVIPFCTSSSSGLGESGELLAEMAGTGDWLEGMRFRFRGRCDRVGGRIGTVTGTAGSNRRNKVETLKESRRKQEETKRRNKKKK